MAQKLKKTVLPNGTEIVTFEDDISPAPQEESKEPQKVAESDN